MEKHCTIKGCFWDAFNKGFLVSLSLPLSRSCLWHVWLLIINKSINARERLSKAFAGAPEESFNVSNNIHNVNHTTAQHKKKRDAENKNYYCYFIPISLFALLQLCILSFRRSHRASGEETRDSKLPFSSCCRARAERKGKKISCWCPRPPLAPTVVFIFIKANKKCAPSNIGETI